MGLFYGHFSNDETAINYFNNTINSSRDVETHGCFGVINEIFQPDESKPFYVGEDVKLEIVQAFAKEFNSIFSNIKMRVVYNNTFYYRNDTWNTQYSPTKKDIHFKPIEFTAFTLDFDKEYTSIVRVCFITIIGELLRVYNENFDMVDYNKDKYIVKDDLYKNFMDKLFSKSIEIDWYNYTEGNSNCFYRSTSLKELMVFDNPKEINKLLYYNKNVKTDENYYPRVFQLNYTELISPTMTLFALRG
jgi:hypothetical protein